MKELLNNDQLYSFYIIVYGFAKDNKLYPYYSLYTMLCFSERDETLLISHIDGDTSLHLIKEKNAKPDLLRPLYIVT